MILCSSKTGLYGYLLSSLLNNNANPSIHYKLIIDENHLSTSFNCLTYFSGDNIIYNGCSDNNIYGIDIKTGEKVVEYKGHIREITVLKTLQKSQEIISGSEDGTVKFWGI